MGTLRDQLLTDALDIVGDPNGLADDVLYQVKVGSVVTSQSVRAVVTVQPALEQDDRQTGKQTFTQRITVSLPSSSLTASTGGWVVWQGDEYSVAQVQVGPVWTKLLCVGTSIHGFGKVRPAAK